MDWLESAQLAAELVESDPRLASRSARALLRHREVPPEARSVAERVLGVASRDLGAPGRAIGHFETAIAHARRAGSPRHEGEARSSLAVAFLQAGDPRRALREWDKAAQLPGIDVPRLLVNRAVILQRWFGRDDEALADYTRAMRILRRSGDLRTEARVLSNRGVLHAYRGEFAAAERDLQRSRRLHESVGAQLAAAEVVHNIGFVHARRGDLPRAIAHYDEAEAAFRDLGLVRAEALIDRCEVLVAMRLLPEAREAAEGALIAAEERGLAADAAEARLVLAQVCLMQSDLAPAREAAARAGEELRRHGRRRLATLARFLTLQADAPVAPPVQLARAACSMVRALDDAGLPGAAMECRIVAARAALAGGQLERARSVLAGGAEARRRGPAALRLRAWHAEALLRVAAGNPGGAMAALRSGLRVAAEHRATLGATELRSRSSTAAVELAELGTELALRSGRPGPVFEWTERVRLGGLEQLPVRPPRDAEMQRLLGRLRETVHRIAVAELGAPTAALLRRQQSLEAEVRRQDHASGVVGPRRSAPARTLRLVELRRALRPDVCLVELVVSGDDLAAVVVTERHARLVPLGSASTIERERAAQLFALNRLALRRAPAVAMAATVLALDESSRRLDEMLLRPVARMIGDRSLVIAPTADLHCLAWSLLATAADRPTVVVPSARLWLERLGCRTTGGTVLVAAPGVENGGSEIARLRAECYPTAVVLDGEDATIGSVAASLEGAGLVHLAAHGQFRWDSPLFSSLRLADGPLTVYDMEALARPPSFIVLSACDLALSHAPAGGEPMGPVAALLRLGTHTVVASVGPVAEAGVEEFMVALHRQLVVGSAPAAALARAQQRYHATGLDPEALAAADPGALAAVAGAGFACIGAG